MSEQQQAVFTIEKVYVKDASLEIPNAPQVFLEEAAPQMEVNVHTGAQALPQEGLFETVLTVTVTAKAAEKTVFLVEIAQAGIFQIRNIPEQEIGAVLAVACPSMLLPYAREAVSSMITRAGFPPVMLHHMNFEALYQQRQQELKAQQQAPAPAPSSN
jgi:preprotein translocase subunit SecB